LYSEPGYELLTSKGIKVGDRVRIRRKDGLVVEGILLPRYSISRRPTIVVKLDSGYNIGIHIDSIVDINVVKREEASLGEEAGSPAVMPLIEETEVFPERPFVVIIGTGGTIASKIEYETGAVKPAFSSEEILEAVPEVGYIANIHAESVMNILSENMKPEYWEQIGRVVAKYISEGADGVIIAHGTDTMGYTAAALSFAFQKLPVPIVFVGSQRSSDRPSSDSALNLVGATLVAARAPFAEVVVVMHGEPSDSYMLAHRGTRVRKMHTSRRDAFQTINDIPLARVYPFEKKIELLKKPLRKRREEELDAKIKFEKKVALIKFYPGMEPEIIDFLVDRGYKGIVIEGTGLGHVGDQLIDSLERAIENDVVVVMTSQTIFGRINMNVYSTGRKLLSIGVIPGDDMLSETAFVKLSWVLANTENREEAKKLMQRNLVGEINRRHTYTVYPRWIH